MIIKPQANRQAIFLSYNWICHTIDTQFNQIMSLLLCFRFVFDFQSFGLFILTQIQLLGSNICCVWLLNYMKRKKPRNRWGETFIVVTWLFLFLLWLIHITGKTKWSSMQLKNFSNHRPEKQISDENHLEIEQWNNKKWAALNNEQQEKMKKSKSKQSNISKLITSQCKKSKRAWREQKRNDRKQSC